MQCSIRYDSYWMFAMWQPVFNIVYVNNSFNSQIWGRYVFSHLLKIRKVIQWEVEKCAWIHTTSKWPICPENVGSLAPSLRRNHWELQAFLMNDWTIMKDRRLNRSSQHTPVKLRWESGVKEKRLSERLHIRQMEIKQLIGCQTWSISFMNTFVPTLVCFQVCWLKFHPHLKILPVIILVIIWSVFISSISWSTWEMARICFVHPCAPGIKTVYMTEQIPENAGFQCFTTFLYLLCFFLGGRGAWR